MYTLHYPLCISDEEYNHLHKILLAGGAIVSAPRDALTNLRASKTIAIIKHENGSVVALAAIKQPNPGYYEKLQQRSGIQVSMESNELGYLAVDSEHRGRGLSNWLLSSLTSRYVGNKLFTVSCNPLTSDSKRRCGFKPVGNTWVGESGNTLQIWTNF